jgi:hypothetical protein
MADSIGAPLDNCFDLVRQTGVTVYELEFIRRWLETLTPKTLGATLVVTTSIYFCLAQEGLIIADMTFIYRQQVDQIKAAMVVPFGDAEEVAADDMDQASFQALISLHAAITNHLVQTAMPLPRMVGYQFGRVMPSLVLAHRLYGDASRADQLVAENKIVHPAFCPPVGRALSA